MTTKIHVTPRDGLLVPDPAVRGGSSAQAMLPKGGKVVVDSTYWRRRARHGDVTIAPATSAPPTPDTSDAMDGDA